MGVLRLAEPGGMKTLAKGQLHAKHNHNDDLSSDFGRGQWDCLYQKLNSTIMVVKATDHRLRCDAAYALDGTMDWSVFAKKPMGPQLVIISAILRQDSA